MSDEQKIKDVGAEELLRLQERYLLAIEHWHDAGEVRRTTPIGHPLYTRALELHAGAIRRVAEANTLIIIEQAKVIARIVAESSTQVESSEQ